MLLEVGRVARAHGIKGEVAIAFTTDRVDERTAPGAVLIIDDKPMTVAASRPHKQQHLVRFEGLVDRNRADRLRGKVVMAEALMESEEIFVHQVIGLDLVDQMGRHHGDVRAVIDNPASDLMELGDGRLVPFTFITEVTDTEVIVDVPAGLLDDLDD